jgi:outer membrane protein OmpA-like peptidoglycan-associated protein
MFKAILTSLLVICLVSIKANAETYSARVDNAKWWVEKSKLKCGLKHTIPNYGEASFIKSAGRNQEFMLTSTIKHFKPAVTKLYAYSPHWYKNNKPIKLHAFKSKKGKMPVYFKKSTPYTMANNLEKGLHVRFDFESSLGKEQVIITPYGFTKAYNEYMSCLNEIVPFTFKQLKHSHIHFVSGSMAILDEDKEVLDAIADTVANDPEIYRVHITGHSDTKGNYRDNRNLALKRMWKVKDYLVFHGVNPDIVTQKGHADAKPIATNKTKEGRAKNRRAEVILYR